MNFEIQEHPMANHATSQNRAITVRASPAARTTSKPLPRYLLLRKGVYYFKRKVPHGLAQAFPTAAGGQVWKSLGTDLLEKARVLLAAELGEFELSAAKARSELAKRAAAAAGAPSVSAQQSSRQVREPSGSGAASASPAPLPVTPVTPVTAAAGHAAARQASISSHAAGMTLRHLLESWKVTQTRHRTIQTFETAVDEFHTLHGALAAQDITREHARRYRDTLVERELSDGTIGNRLGFLGTIFRFGQVELIEHVLGNPFERIRINGGKRQRVAKDRRAYTQQELNTIFSSKLYTKGYRPKGQTAEAAYWAPLLGPFVGARIEELAQLRVDDVEQINGNWCFRIWALASDQHLKTFSSYRRVPLHDVLVRCGFVRFVQQQRSAGHARLFPTLSNDNANETWSNALGKWYARYLDDIGLKDPSLDYHSYRYSFRQQCTLCGIENETRDALTGHWVGRRDSGRTYMRAEERQYPFPKLVDAMKQLHYDELKLSHLFVAEETDQRSLSNHQAAPREESCQFGPSQSRPRNNRGAALSACAKVVGIHTEL
jgi:integrase